MAVSKVILNGTTLIDLTDDTVVASKLVSGYTATGADGIEISGTIASKSSSNLTISGNTVTAPAGYYAADASASIAAGSATTPTTSIASNPTVSINSSGLVTATHSGSLSITPTVIAGYISNGTAGTVSTNGSGTLQLTTKAATTYTPSSTDQTIAADQYLIGVQTISGDANLVAANIVSGVTIFGVTGTASGGGTPMTYQEVWEAACEGWGVNPVMSSAQIHTAVDTGWGN